MIYEIADNCVREVEKLSDNWEIFIANSETIEVESKNDILNFAKEEIEMIRNKNISLLKKIVKIFRKISKKLWKILKVCAIMGG